MHASLVKFHPLFQEISWIQELNVYGDAETYANTDANINGICCTETYMSPLTFGGGVGVGGRHNKFLFLRVFIGR